MTAIMDDNHGTINRLW